MNFDISDEQRQLADSLGRYLDREYSFDLRQKFAKSSLGYSKKAWQVYADLGLLALPLPEAYGGYGGSAVNLMSIMQLMGAALVLEPYISTLVGARLIARLGSDSQRAELLPIVAEGGAILALAHGERGVRYQRSHVALSALPIGNGWRLTGTKAGVVHGSVADRLLVSARTNGTEREEEGISLFLLDPSMPGITRFPYRSIDGLPACDILISDVELPREALLGQAGMAHAAIDEALDYASSIACSEAVGIIGFANAHTLDYIKNRQQYGRPIGKFQVLQHRMVNLMITHEQATSMAYLSCLNADTEPSPTERARIVSAARICLIEAGRQVSQDTVQMHGAIGLTEEIKLSHCFRRLLVLGAIYGDLDFHLTRFSALNYAMDPILEKSGNGTAALHKKYSS